MKKILIMLIALALIAGCQNTNNKQSDPEITDTNNPIVVFETSMGNFEVELYEEKSPISVGNFLDYVSINFYDGLIFHRVIDSFMIQGGGFTSDMRMKEPNDAIRNEATNGLSNEKYTIAMARTQVINSATSQFFINVVDNTRLDYKGESSQDYGYAVFGKVIKGFEVIDSIKSVKTGPNGAHQDVPIEPIVMNKVYLKK